MISFDVSSVTDARKRRCLQMLVEQAEDRIEEIYAYLQEQRTRNSVSEELSHDDSSAIKKIQGNLHKRISLTSIYDIHLIHRIIALLFMFM